MGGFDASLILAGPSGFGQGLASGIADLRKKRQHEEEQMAYNQTAYQTLVNAGVLSEEERQKFTSGNLNAKNGIVAAGGARLLQKLQTDRERETRNYRLAELALKKQYYDAHTQSTASPQVDPSTGLVWNGRQWIKPASSAQNSKWAGAIPIARGTLKGGDFYNNYAGAENGDQIQLQMPDGKTKVTIPYASWLAHGGQNQATTAPDADAAPAVTAPVAPAAPVAPTRVKVISPDGKTGTLPADQVQEALKQGFKLG